MARRVPIQILYTELDGTFAFHDHLLMLKM